MGQIGPTPPVRRGRKLHQIHLVQPNYDLQLNYDDLRAAIDDYLFALESEGRAVKTCEIYGLALGHFHRFAAGALLARVRAPERPDDPPLPFTPASPTPTRTSSGTPSR